MTTGKLHIKVTGLRNEEGHVRVVLFNSDEGFPGNWRKAYRLSEEGISNGEALVPFNEVPYGKYAVIILHDENDNDRLDVNELTHLPKEGLGMSNAPENRHHMHFSDAAFTFEQPEMTVEIQPVYKGG